MTAPAPSVACSCRCSVNHPDKGVCTGVAEVDVVKVSWDQAIATEKVCKACNDATCQVKKDKWDASLGMKLT